jgi:Icc-related predicted phosphoesterase
MHIYAVADIHGSQFRLNIALDQIGKNDPDLVVICGDITQFGPADVATNFLNQISVDTLAVHGNCDPDTTLEAIDRSKAENIHLKKVNRKGIDFIGIGGVLDQFDAQRFLTMNAGRKPLRDILTSACVLVSHVPPFKTMDRVFIGHHAGSKDLRSIIDTFQPRLVLCGHIHENPGMIKVGESVVVNCSMGKRTAGALIDIDSSIDVKMLI